MVTPQDCKDSQVWNPKTKRCIDKNGKTAKNLYLEHLKKKIEMLPGNVTKMQNKTKIAKRDSGKNMAKNSLEKKKTPPDSKPLGKSPEFSADNILDYIDKTVKPSFEVEVSPPDYVLPNRAKWSSWIDVAFWKDISQQNQTRNSELTSLFYHQKFVKDYLQNSSPYRGLLLYHALGSGKTSTSIAAAEILMQHRDVIVMLPASLSPNFLNEVKTYGSRLYTRNQHWVFLEYERIEEKIEEVCKKLKLDIKVLLKNGGLWLPSHQNQESNWGSLSHQNQIEIESQNESIILARYQFIHYNGLTKSKLKELQSGEPKEGGGICPELKIHNIFDNKCVIVDEVHNLISRIINGRKIGKQLYQMLYAAKNVKLIFLSGTPIINSPHEISYLINLITGPKTRYLIKTNGHSQDKIDQIMHVLQDNHAIDYWEITTQKRGIYFYMLPDTFEYTDRKNLKIRKSDKLQDNKGEINKLLKKLKRFEIDRGDIKAECETTLPESLEEFKKYFMDDTESKIINKQMFMKRILGCISYYSTYPRGLYPTKTEIQIIKVEQSDYQFGIYQMSRTAERKQEKAIKKIKKSGDTTLGQLYRFYSRSNCNFVFPEEIKRPVPKSKQKGAEILELDSGLYDTDDEEKQFLQKNEKDNLYKKNLKNALELLEENGDKYLTLPKLKIYSPKFYQIITQISSLKGTALVYSQFKEVEGHKILGMALKQQGYAELKLKKKPGMVTWNLDIDEQDIHKPKFIVLNPKEEASKILMRLFNNDFTDLPPTIKNRLGIESDPKTLLATQTSFASTKSASGRAFPNNLYGDLIKIAMITQSGAEGISLKNVRQVHLLEPYWNQIRINQVIGRAIRVNSHEDFENQEERHVDIFLYCSKFTPEQSGQVTIKKQDGGKTTDEYILEIAKAKDKITQEILGLMQQASVDCVLNANLHNKDRLDKERIKCFSFPTNIDANSIVVQNDIQNDYQDHQYDATIKPEDWKGEILKTKQGTFLINQKNGDVFHYDIWKTSGKLDKIGHCTITGGKRTINFIS